MLADLLRISSTLIALAMMVGLNCWLLWAFRHRLGNALGLSNSPEQPMGPETAWAPVEQAAIVRPNWNRRQSAHPFPRMSQPVRLAS